jgi:hypothetical protein
MDHKKVIHKYFIFIIQKIIMARIVLPGDFITDNFNVVSTKAPRLVGFGLEKRTDGIYAMIAGILVETENKLWLNTSTKR